MSIYGTPRRPEDFAKVIRCFTDGDVCVPADTTETANRPDSDDTITDEAQE